ncbi:MAG TPA: hypothetical protein VK610_01105 [Rhodothermales bacterium]|nr:hypothetical protein [Rhodothermales bacterium]
MSVVPESDEPPTPGAFDALIALIPAFEDPAFSPGAWAGQEGQAPWFVLSEPLPPSSTPPTPGAGW